MTDTMTPQQRHNCMSRIRGKDTKPEMIVRRYLFSKGLRYRVNCRKLPGTPDIVLRKYKTVVFIDGCFWHGHEGCKHFKLPKSNTLFWRHKIAMNYARDISNNTELQLAGWRVIRIWECEIRTKATQEETLENLYLMITAPRAIDRPIHPFKDIPTVPRPYEDYSEEPLSAAESESDYGETEA